MANDEPDPPPLSAAADLRRTRLSVDLYPDVRQSRNPSQTTLDALAEQTAAGRWSDAIRIIRQEHDEERRTKAKAALPAVTFSLLGALTRGTQSLDSGIAAHTGLFVYDLDHLSDFGLTPEQLSARLASRKPEGVVMAFTSPSGDGYKIVLKAEDPPAAAAAHSERYPILAEHLRALLSLPDGVIDESTRDCSRLCFVSHDPAVFFAPDCDPISPESETMAAEMVDIRRDAAEIAERIDTSGIEYLTTVEDLALRLLEAYGPRLLMTTDSAGGEAVWLDVEGAGIWKHGMVRKANAIPAAALGNWVRDVVTEARIQWKTSDSPPKLPNGDPTTLARQVVTSAFVIAVSPELNPGNKLGVRLAEETALDANQRYMGARNGVIDLHTGEILYGDSAADALVTKTIPHDYDAEATSSLVDRLVEHLPPDYAEYLLDSLAFSIKGNPARTFVWVHGPLKSGKTALVRAMKAAFGSYVSQMQAAVLTPGQGDNSGASPYIASVLPPVRIAFVSEAESARIDPAKLKMYSGDDYVSWRPLYKAARDDRPSATIWFVGNMEPRSGFGTADPAVADRMRVVTYGQIPKDKIDPGFVAAWDTDSRACQALVTMMTRRAAALTAPPRMPPSLERELGMVISRDANALSQWFLDALTVTGDSADKVSSLAVWQAASKEFGQTDNRVENFTRRSFTLRLQRELRLPGSQPITIGAKTARGWSGIRFTDPETAAALSEAVAQDDPYRDC